MKSSHDYKFKLNAAGIPGILLAAKPLISLLTTRRRDLDDYSAVDASAMVNIIYTFIILEQCLMEFERERDIPYMRMILGTNLRWFAFFTIWGGITMLWSVNSALTGFRTLECAAYFLLIVIVATKLIFRHGIPVMFGWFIHWYLMPDIVLRTAQRVLAGGDLDYILTVAQMSAPVFFYLVWFHGQSRIIKAVVSVLSFLSHSTTSYIGLAVGSLCLWFGEEKKKALAFLLLLVVGLGVLWIGPEKFLKDTIFRERSGIGLEYTSGRDKLWAYAWECGLERPLGGYGFFSAEPFLFYDANLGGINCHSSFLSAFVGTGFIGLVLISLYILSYIPMLLTPSIPQAYRSALMGCYAVALLQCLGNPGIGSRVYGGWLPVTILFVMISAIDFQSRTSNVIRNGT